MKTYSHKSFRSCFEVEREEEAKPTRERVREKKCVWQTEKKKYREIMINGCCRTNSELEELGTRVVDTFGGLRGRLKKRLRVIPLVARVTTRPLLYLLSCCVSLSSIGRDDDQGSSEPLYFFLCAGRYPLCYATKMYWPSTKGKCW